MQRQYAPIPVIIGNNANETLGWADTAGPVTDEASYGAALDRVFGAAARDQILALYPASAYASPREAFAQVTTDAEFTCKSRAVARALSQAQKEPVFRYFFNQMLENDPQLKERRVDHTIEQAFLFGWQGKYQPSDIERTVQRQLVGYWIRMAKVGNPNGGGAVEWTAASATNDAYLEIGATVVPRSGPANAHCDFWDRTPLL